MKLLIFDFDGTALGGHEPYAQFPPEFASFLDELAGFGVQWATNTTWGVNEQWEVICKSGVSSLPLFLSGNTGRQLAKISDGHAVLLPEHECFIQQQDESFKQEHWPQIRSVMIELLEKDLVTRLAFDFFQSQSLLDCSCRPGCIEAVTEVIKPLLDEGIYYSFSAGLRETFCLLPRHMTKAEVIRKMQDLSGIAASETMVAGDGINDLAMMDAGLAAGLVCPENADERIKALVLRHNGIVSEKKFSWGVIEGVRALLQDQC